MCRPIISVIIILLAPTVDCVMCTRCGTTIATECEQDERPVTLYNSHFCKTKSDDLVIDRVLMKNCEDLQMRFLCDSSLLGENTQMCYETCSLHDVVSKGPSPTAAFTPTRTTVIWAIFLILL